MRKTHNPNDKFFKAAFRYPSIVQEFLEYFMPEKLVNSLDFKTLTLDSTNYIGDNLAEYYSDVVYTCNINGKAVKVILLFEHKTSIGHDIYLQLMIYIIAILKQNHISHKRYDIVIPIVIYQGTDKFEKRQFHTYFEDLDPQFIPYIPQFNFELVDIQKIGDEEILSFSDDSPFKGVLLTMKHSKEKSFIKKYFEEILRFSTDKPYWDDLFKQIIVYLSEKLNLGKDEMSEIINSQLNENLIMKSVTAVQEWILEGTIKGKLEAQIEFAKEAWVEGYTPEAVSKLTKLPIEEIKQLYRKFESQVKVKH